MLPIEEMVAQRSDAGLASTPTARPTTSHASQKGMSGMRAVLVLSGGIDSFTAGASAIDHGAEIYALSFDYQQVNDRELRAAAETARSLGARDHRVMTLDLGLGEYGRSSLLKSESGGPLDGARGDFGMYVPARHAIFLACALGYAEVTEAHAIVMGASGLAMGSRRSLHRDCQPEFFTAFQRMAREATDVKTDIEVYCPLMYMNKKEIVAYGLERGLDYGLSWTCHGAGDKHCGRCRTCQLRLYAFYSLDVEDPVPYELGFDHWVETYRQQWDAALAT